MSDYTDEAWVQTKSLFKGAHTQELTITISGLRGHGKTSVAYLVENTLHEVGYITLRRDNSTNEEIYACRTPEAFLSGS